MKEGWHERFLRMGRYNFFVGINSCEPVCTIRLDRSGGSDRPVHFAGHSLRMVGSRPERGMPFGVPLTLRLGLALFGTQEGLMILARLSDSSLENDNNHSDRRIMKEKKPQFLKMNASREDNPPHREVVCPDYRRCLTEAAFKNYSLDCSLCAAIEIPDDLPAAGGRVSLQSSGRISATLAIHG